MPKLRILMTNNTLARRAGSELYVRDVAMGLLARGHLPIVYSTVLGEVAEELRLATIPVIDHLDALGEPPHVIHGQHHLETMTAMLHFPDAPAIYVCHGWLPWEEAPPRFPRIYRYVAVDDTCRDRMVCEHGIPIAETRVMYNFVDLNRFRPRGPLPARPRRGLVFNNSAREQNFLPIVREACERAGVELDVMGLGVGKAEAHPEEALGRYDLIFATGRSAIESMAVGAAVVLCSDRGLGPMVTTVELDRLRALNFGIRTIRAPHAADTLAREIARYDAADAMAVSARMRAEADREAVVDQWVDLYRGAIAAHAEHGPHDRAAEGQAAAAYLRRLSPPLKDYGQARAERDWFKSEIEMLQRSPWFRMRETMLRAPGLRRLYRKLRGIEQEDAKKKSMP